MNPKGDLIEHCRAEGLGEPTFESTASGPSHQPHFLCVVQLQGREVGRGEGRSRREAERAASQAALQRLGHPLPAAPAVTDRAVRWPIYAELLSNALIVAHERGEDASLEQVRVDAARLYQGLLSDLGVRPEPEDE
ncbi:putative dsRNA-binding protein [Deinococcus sonorensis]|uniref:DsRNA-binding protein n=2 Tax=Deinococcus sonorensis TaxID=309891 RepID=A0AAU7UDD4_9DEIO